MDEDFDEPGGFNERDELGEPDDIEPGLPWFPPAYPPPRNTAHCRGTRAARMAATAVLAGTAAFAVVTALHDAMSSPAANASPGTTAPSGGAGNLLPPETGGGTIPPPEPGQVLQLDIAGTVTAVSATSITLEAHGQSVTAAVTKSTVVTGKARGIGGVKVGDLVSAQITGTGGKLTATAVQDPASIP
jgi:hypothetical protein